MRISIPLEKAHPVEMTTALKFDFFAEIMALKVWGTFWGVPAPIYLINQALSPCFYSPKGPMDSHEIETISLPHGSTLVASTKNDEASCLKKRKSRLSEAQKLAVSTSSSERSRKRQHRAFLSRRWFTSTSDETSIWCSGWSRYSRCPYSSECQWSLSLESIRQSSPC